MDASILTRELPFGESLRSTRKILYRIEDPTTRFWSRVYSAHRSLWEKIRKDLAERWSRCTLRHRHPRVRFEVLDAGILRGVRLRTD